MSDVFREVDEELRSEQMKSLWDRFGPWLIGAAVLVVAIVATFRGWSWYSERGAAEAGVKFEQAAEAAAQGNEAEALRQMEGLRQSGPGGYPELAALEIAGLKAQTGDIEGAVADYDAFAANNSNDEDLRNVAALQAAFYLLDTADAATIRSRLDGLATSDTVWKSQALEIIALALWKAGELEDAGNIYREISADFQAPRGVRQRSAIVLNLMAPDIQAAGSATETSE